MRDPPHKHTHYPHTPTTTRRRRRHNILLNRHNTPVGNPQKENNIMLPAIERRIYELKDIKNDLRNISHRITAAQRADIADIQSRLAATVRKLKIYSDYHFQMQTKYRKFAKRHNRVPGNWRWHCRDCSRAQKGYISRDTASTGATRHTFQTNHTHLSIKQGGI